MRIGHGYDAHRFVSGRDLMLGGVKIPSEYGLDGHSDADVLIHAICDALLGAAGDRDIGYHFPDKDDVYKDIASVKLLARVADLLAVKGYTVSNLDCTVIAEYPRLSPYIEKMEDTVASVLRIGKDRINIKATTEEGMGFTGSREGICAHAVCLLNESDL